MKFSPLALCALVASLTFSAGAAAHPYFYTEVVQDLNAEGCTPSTFDTVPGCTNLCHIDDPNSSGMILPTQAPKPFCALLMQNFGWAVNGASTASSLDAPLAALEADKAYAQVVTTIRNSCTDPTAEIEAVAGDGGVSEQLVAPVFGCTMGRAVSTRASSAVLLGLGLGVLVAMRRRRRGSAPLVLACGLLGGCYYPTDGVNPTVDAGAEGGARKCTLPDGAVLRDTGVVDSTIIKDASADVPVFTLDAGTTWSSLYRDYFGPSGVASCAGTGLYKGQCHGETTGTGYENSCSIMKHCFYCPDGDASTACWASLVSTGDGGANVITPGGTFSADYLSGVLCSSTSPPEGVYAMPYSGAYCFGAVDLERIADWVNAGAKNN
jgi:hypothetical protein